MMSSTGTSSNNGQRTDQNGTYQGSQNNQQTQESLILQMLSNSNAVSPQEFQYNESTYRRCPMHKRVTFNLNNTDLNSITNDFSISLVDRGCNGGFLDKNARILSIKDNYFADVIGMNNSKVSQVSHWHRMYENKYPARAR